MSLDVVLYDTEVTCHRVSGHTPKQLNSISRKNFGRSLKCYAECQ